MNCRLRHQYSSWAPSARKSGVAQGLIRNVQRRPWAMSTRNVNGNTISRGRIRILD
jgi:hypothetical protein